MIVKRNLLCIKKRQKLKAGDLLLYEPYKTKLRNLVDLATRLEAKFFDPVSAIYDGLGSVPKEIKSYYEALTGVTSYYQASKGGRGTYLEKKLASEAPLCCNKVTLSDLPIWLERPQVCKKAKLFGEDALAANERRTLKNTKRKWDIPNHLQDLM